MKSRFKCIHAGNFISENEFFFLYNFKSKKSCIYCTLGIKIFGVDLFKPHVLAVTRSCFIFSIQQQNISIIKYIHHDIYICVQNVRLPYQPGR